MLLFSSMEIPILLFILFVIPSVVFVVQLYNHYHFHINNAFNQEYLIGSCLQLLMINPNIYPLFGNEMFHSLSEQVSYAVSIDRDYFP